MKVLVENLRPNPFRDLSICPIIDEKVDRLVNSYNETGFWDNIVGRMGDEPDIVEVAYGYHRLIALEKAGIEEVDIPIRDLSDADMIRMMGAENYEWFTKSTKVTTETVKAAKDRIEREIYEKNYNYDDLEPWCKELFDGEHGFKSTTGRWGLYQNKHTLKIGRKIIEKFLGDTYNLNDVAHALRLIYGEVEVQERVEIPSTSEVVTIPRTIKISKEAAEEFEVTGQSRAFVDTLAKDENARSAFNTEEAQVKLAHDIKEEVLQEQRRDAREHDKPLPDTPTLSAKEITQRIREKATEVVSNGVVPMTEEEKELEKEREAFIKAQSEKIPKALKETKSLYDRIVPHYYSKDKSKQGLVFPWKEKVYTETMAQRQLNMLYEIQYHLEKYRHTLEKETGLKADPDVVKYDIVPIYDPEEEKRYIGEISSHLATGSFIEELDDDAEDWLNRWKESAKEEINDYRETEEVYKEN